MRLAIIQFPASNCDQDSLHAIRVLGHQAEFVWHKDTTLDGFDAVIVPGGFSYGDYLRCGAIARFSPIMAAVQAFARDGGLVLGICNGFQILCEAGLLPGALVRNRDLQFRCEPVYLNVATRNTPFTCRIPPGKVLRVPVAHGEGCYFADETTLDRLAANDQILWQYCDHSGAVTEAASPNGSMRNIAGICNSTRNVAALMPHPERASEAVLGSTDGRLILESMLYSLATRSGAR